MKTLNPELKTYIKKHILPIYQSFDMAHQTDHIDVVVNASFELASTLDVNINMVYTIACYHDIGIQYGRDNHHITGGIFLLEDQNLKSFFQHEELLIMKEAIEDHRASNPSQPRSIYGKIIAEADRDLSFERILKRTIGYGIKVYPDLTFEEHYDRLYQHIKQKYGENGYLKLWLKAEKNEVNLSIIRKALNHPDQLKEKVFEIYQKYQ